MSRSQRNSSFLITTVVSGGILYTACVPGSYTAAPLPVNARRSAASGPGTNVNPSTTGTPQGTTTPNAGGGTTINPSSSAGGPATGGVTFAPGVPDVDALKKCMNLWGTVPFKEIKPQNVKVMDVSVGVGGGLLGSTSPLAGLGNIINIGNTKDLEVTNEPRLIILPLSVNLGGNTTFELMNPNGWYCIKAAVGAKSTVNIKLNCTAKLAQSDLGVSLDTNPAGAPIPVKVGINDGKTPGGQLGIMVDSSVNLTRVGSNGAACAP